MNEETLKRTAEIERLKAELVAQSDIHTEIQMRLSDERDALRALMRNVIDDDHYHMLAERTRARIDAALKEIKP